jgi:hypothetical protein
MEEKIGCGKGISVNETAGLIYREVRLNDKLNLFDTSFFLPIGLF